MHLGHVRRSSQRAQHVGEAADALLAQPIADAGAKRGGVPALSHEQQAGEGRRAGAFEVDGRDADAPGKH